MEINVNGKVMTVALEGEIDHLGADAVRDKIERAFERSVCKHMVFDFSRVSFMDSSGIGMLIGRYKQAEKRGGTLNIASMSGELKRIYNISGLAKIARCYDTLEDAERAVAYE